MNRFSRSLPVFFLLLSLGTLSISCASIGRDFPIQEAGTLTIGQTTMAEARQALGSPVHEIDVATWGEKRFHFGDEKDTTIWLYLYASGSALDVHARSMEVDFDKDGRVDNYNYYSTYGEDKVPQVEDKDLVNFDIFEAKKKIIRHKTTQDDLLGMFGKPQRQLTIKKPGVQQRWIYFYKEKSETDKVTLSSGLIDRSYNVVYQKNVCVDLDQDGVVADVRGESDFPSDKDRYFTK